MLKWLMGNVQLGGKKEDECCNKSQVEPKSVALWLIAQRQT